MIVTVSTAEATGDAGGLLALYDRAVGDVYGYLLRRCRSRAEAEDLTSEVFLAAVAAVVRRPPSELTVGWLIGIARHKLVDHWRRLEREQRRLRAVADEPDGVAVIDEWDVRLDALAARDVLAQLGAHHRAALTLRYLDGLAVPEVASVLDRTVHATEALLVRARAAFRQRYEAQSPPRGGRVEP
jgi:RNA polymerase sigma-70 factor, ECF subfamily